MKIIVFIIFLTVSSFLSRGQILNVEWVKSGDSQTPNFDNAWDFTVDDTGNVYVLGYFSGTTDFDYGPSVYNLTSVGGKNIYVQKLDPLGNHVWTKTFNGGFTSGIDIDTNGDLLLMGTYEDSADLDPGPGSFNVISEGGYDFFVVKLDNSGNFIWGKSFGGSYDETFTLGHIVTDDANNVYVGGDVYGIVNLDEGIGNVNTVWGDHGFVIKYDENGTYQWSYVVGDADFGAVSHINVDDQDNLFVFGYINGTMDMDPSDTTELMVTTEGSDGFIQKVDSFGNLIWLELFGPDNGAPAMLASDFDSHGNIVIAGIFNGVADFDPGPDEYLLTNVLQADYCVFKLDSEANFLWAKAMKSLDVQRPKGIGVDNNDDIYIGGNFKGNVDFDPGGGYDIHSSNGEYQMFMHKLSEHGDHRWAFSLGNLDGDRIVELIVDDSGYIYTAGYYSLTVDFDPGQGNYPYTAQGNNDLFIAKYSENCYINDYMIYLDPELTVYNLYDEYQWLNCDSGYAEIIGETGQTFMSAYNGNFAVEITENGCIDTSSCFNISESPSLSTYEFTDFGTQMLYPNPSSGLVYFQTPNTDDVVVIQLFNMLGELVYSYRLLPQHINEIDLDLNSGVYLISIEQGDLIFQKKITIQK